MSVEVERMRTALDLHDLGVKLYRQRMCRDRPSASPREIDALVREWLVASSSPPVRRDHTEPVDGHAG